jgi:hypothetical protein
MDEMDEIYYLHFFIFSSISELFVVDSLDPPSRGIPGTI